MNENTQHDKIPTNHGNLLINEIFDHLNYVSYKVQRDAGCSFEILKKWYNKAEEFEKIYNSPKN